MNNLNINQIVGYGDNDNDEIRIKIKGFIEEGYARENERYTGDDRVPILRIHDEFDLEIAAIWRKESYDGDGDYFNIRIKRCGKFYFFKMIPDLRGKHDFIIKFTGNQNIDDSSIVNRVPFLRNM